MAGDSKDPHKQWQDSGEELKIKAGPRRPVVSQKAEPQISNEELNRARQIARVKQFREEVGYGVPLPDLGLDIDIIEQDQINAQRIRDDDIGSVVPDDDVGSLVPDDDIGSVVPTVSRPDGGAPVTVMPAAPYVAATVSRPDGVAPATVTSALPPVSVPTVSRSDGSSPVTITTGGTQVSSELSTKASPLGIDSSRSSIPSPPSHLTNPSASSNQSIGTDRTMVGGRYIDTAVIPPPVAVDTVSGSRSPLSETATQPVTQGRGSSGRKIALGKATDSVLLDSPHKRTVSILPGPPLTSMYKTASVEKASEQGNSAKPVAPIDPPKPSSKSR